MCNHKEVQHQRHGHVSRSSDLAKTILQCTVKGGTRQGRQKKRWEHNIEEWTGLRFSMGSGKQRKMEETVVKSSVVPQRPPRLRDRSRRRWPTTEISPRQNELKHHGRAKNISHRLRNQHGYISLPKSKVNRSQVDSETHLLPLLRLPESVLG